LSAAFQKLVEDYIATKYHKRETPLAEVQVLASVAKPSLRVLA
jgi:hypothetical protein